MSEPEQMLNPQVKDVTIGILDLRTIQIYPLSLGDQLSLTNKVMEVLSSFYKAEASKNEMEFAVLIVSLIQDNILDILGMIAYETNGDEPPKKIKSDDELLNELTNMQLSEIIRIVYETNYAGPGKNLEGLLEMIKTIFPSSGPSPLSVSGMDINLETSTEEDISKEE